jgi:hypothetical protein
MGEIREVYTLAALQHGVVSHEQFLDAGFGRSAIHRRVTRGEWIRIDHGVFAVATSPPTWERQLMGALLSRPLAIVGHTSAGYLLGLKSCRPSRPVLVVPAGSNARSGAARIIESDQFERLATTRIEVFPVTTVPETLLSLAADFQPEDLEDVFDDAVLTGKLDLDSMKRVLDREVGRRPRGITTLRRLTARALPTAPSHQATYLEAVLERLLLSLPLPPWLREHPFSINGSPARVDVYIPDWSLVVEADGRNWHMRRADFENDRRRDNDLAARGIQVIRYTYKMLVDDEARCGQQILDVGRYRTMTRSA